MKFILSTAIASAFFAVLASASNTLLTPKQGEVVKSGHPYLMKWETDTTGPVMLDLKKGDSKNLETVSRIVMLEYNWGNYTWDVPADLPDGKDYAFQITWGKDPKPEDVNYTYQFEISGDDSEEEPKSTTTEEASATETETKTVEDKETATETKTEEPTETETDTETEQETGKDNSTVSETSTTGGNTTKTTATKTSTGPTVTPEVKDDDSSAGSFGASAGMAAAVALAAAALL